jgi:hypothetical protein
MVSAITRSGGGSAPLNRTRYALSAITFSGVHTSMSEANCSYRGLPVFCDFLRASNKSLQPKGHLTATKDEPVELAQLNKSTSMISCKAFGC